VGKVRPERDADPSPPSSTEVKYRVALLSLRAFVAYESVKPTCTEEGKGSEGALKRAILLPFADFAKRDKRQNVCCSC
jgi:hypothetical protein